MNRRTFAGITATLALLMSSAGCVPQPGSGATALQTHTIHSEPLRALMRELEHSRYDNDSSVLERDDATIRYALRLAATLQQSSRRIRTFPETPDFAIAEKDKERFVGYADALAEEGARIERLARDFETEVLPEAVRRVDRICFQCHEAFKEASR